MYFPDSSASSLLFTDLFERLAATGYRVTVLCGFPTKGEGTELNHLPRRGTVSGVTIVRCGLRVRGKRTLLTRAAVYGSFLLHAGWTVLRHYRKARIVGGTDPPFTAAALYLLSRIRRLRYDLILLDVYPDGLIALGTLRESSILTRWWRTLNRLSYAAAEHLIVIGRDMVPILSERYGVPRVKPTYIPHWAPREIATSPASDSRALLREWGLEEKFVVQYSGNMGLWHDINTLVLAAQELRHMSHIHFLFIGNGMRRKAAQALAADLGLTNITWLDLMPRDRLSESLASCDAALISFRFGLEGVAVPSKLYGILASGTPVIAQVPEDTEVALTVREECCGIVVPPGDASALATAISSFAQNPDDVAAMGVRARDAYRRKYTLDHAVAAYRSLWDEPDA